MKSPFYFLVKPIGDRYTNVKKMNFNVVITMSDNQGDTRELCIKKDDEEAETDISAAEPDTPAAEPADEPADEPEL